MMITVVLFWWIIMWFTVSAVLSVPTWGLWNWLVPELFGLPEISLVQTFGLLLLASCLVGSKPEIKLGNAD